MAGPMVRFFLRRYRVLFVALLALAFLHEILFVYLFGFWKEQVEISGFLMRLIPETVKERSPIPLGDLTHPATYKALIYLRPDLRAIQLAFGIALGTDVIAGEVGRGTSDLLYAHPVRRTTAVLAGMLTVALHALCLGAASLAGFRTATALYPMGPGQPEFARVLPCVANIALATTAIAMIAFLAGSLASSRGRAVLASLLLVALPVALDFAGLFSKTIGLLTRLFPEHYYRPHTLLLAAEGPGFGESAWKLVLIGGICASLALLCAQRRDLAAG